MMKSIKLPDKLSRTFCMAPWVHIQQNSYGEVNPCCVFLPTETPYKDFKTKYNSLEKAFNGDENKKLREQMLAGKRIDGCEKCYVEEEEDGSREGAIKYSFRNHFNDRYYNEYNISNPAIRDIEFSLGNKCNYKCITCNTRFSSAWYTDDIKYNVVDTYNGRLVKNSLPDIDLTKLKELKVLGGETFLDNSYLELFKMIKCEEIKLTLYTNNSVFPKQEWLDYFDRFKYIKLNISIDGVYDVGEFVRLGIKFSRFENNFKKWILFTGKYKNIELNPHYVFHNLNSLNLNKTLIWLENIYDQMLKIEDRISYTFLYGPDKLNPSFLPNDTKKIIINNNNNNFLTDKLKKFLLTNETDDNICKDFIKYIDLLKLRNPLPEECGIIYDSVKKYNERKK